MSKCKTNRNSKEDAIKADCPGPRGLETQPSDCRGDQLAAVGARDRRDGPDTQQRAHMARQVVGVEPDRAGLSVPAIERSQPSA
jgi:hypothetical protein